MRSKKNKLLLIVAGTVWFLTVSAGVAFLWNYENTPGAAAAAAPDQWPANSQIQRATDRATLVMMVHPHCPCTRASVGELARLMAQTQGRVTAYVLFNKPLSLSKDWEQTDMLYDKDGYLLFSGGITGGRGHEGDNAGRSAIVSLINTNEAEQSETAVFGCALFAQDECQTGKEASHPKQSH